MCGLQSSRNNCFNNMIGQLVDTHRECTLNGTSPDVYGARPVTRMNGQLEGSREWQSLWLTPAQPKAPRVTAALGHKQSPSKSLRGTWDTSLPNSMEQGTEVFK